MLTRLLDQERPSIVLQVDGVGIAAKQGDTLLTAMLAAGLGHVRTSEFGDGGRAGFCWMGACQECWVMVAGQGLKRACSTLAEAGMQVVRR